MTEPIDILVSEVGPRDGLQSISPILPLEAKKAWIAAEAAAGVREIEVGSFVPAKVLPQLADTAEVVAFARTIPGLTVAVLVPNARGAAAAIEAGAHKLTLPLSVSETHSLRNLRRTHDQVLAEAREIAAMVAAVPQDSRPHFEGSLSTAFGCTLEGAIPDAQIARLAEGLMAAGCDEVGLDWTVDIGDARRRVGSKVALQGNLDPSVLFCPPDVVQREAGKVIQAFGSGPGHVFNLGHGVSRFTPPDTVAALVETVHAQSRALR